MTFIHFSDTEGPGRAFIYLNVGQVAKAIWDEDQQLLTLVVAHPDLRREGFRKYVLRGQEAAEALKILQQM
jgi:hypothetical protein